MYPVWCISFVRPIRNAKIPILWSLRYIANYKTPLYSVPPGCNFCLRENNSAPDCQPLCVPRKSTDYRGRKNKEGRKENRVVDLLATISSSLRLSLFFFSPSSLEIRRCVLSESLSHFFLSQTQFLLRQSRTMIGKVDFANQKNLFKK